MLEVEMLFSIYKVALKEELEFALEAFINKNHIFPLDDNGDDRPEPTDEEAKRAKAIAERMLSMGKVAVHKQLR